MTQQAIQSRLSAAHEHHSYRRPARSARFTFRFVNWALAAGTLAAVLGFGSSDALAGAFGIAVSLLMVITTLMATFVALHWKHNPLDRLHRQRQPARPRFVLFRLDLDEAPRRRLVPLADRFRHRVPDADLAQGRGDHGRGSPGDPREVRPTSSNASKRDPPLRIPGTAVVLGRMTKGVPLALSHNVKCNHVLHENVLLVAVATTETPRVPDEDRVVVAPIAEGITRVGLRFGFMEQPNVPEGLAIAVGARPDRRIRSRESDLLHRSRDDHPDGAAQRDGAMARSAVRVQQFGGGFHVFAQGGVSEIK